MADLKKVGAYIPMDDIKGFVGNHENATKQGGDSFAKLFHENGAKPNEVLVRKAEFFGREIIEKLLALNVPGKNVVGIRIYFGVASEYQEGGVTKIQHKPHPQGTSKPRLFLVPVDENGNDIQFDESQLKGGPSGSGGGDGTPCPSFCSN